MGRLARLVQQLLRLFARPKAGKRKAYFLRVFAQQGLLSHWLEQECPLPKLLSCFDIKREQPRPNPVSVYRVGTEIEELEAVAAVFLTTPTTPEKRFGIL